MHLAHLTEALVALSEKAAHLARLIRSEQALFELLIEEKTGDAKNKRFVQDFKTLADVLVQEMVKHEVGNRFPALYNHIYGEECNLFTNGLGETIEVCIQPTVDGTSNLLAGVLCGNTKAAGLLASAVHQPAPETAAIVKARQILADVYTEIDDDALGVWIDPIDSTAQYISGQAGTEESGIYSEGLRCVTVLIGVYHRHSGRPLIGVVNQPFSTLSPPNNWVGLCSWGLSCGQVQLWQSGPPLPEQPPTVVMSSSEAQRVQERLKQTHFRLVYAAGAGYKVQCVTEGRAAAYLLTKPSTFRWDTCAPHALLLAQSGGGILHFRRAIRTMAEYGPNRDVSGLKQRLEACQLTYHKANEEGDQWSNAGGLIAYRDLDTVIELLKALV